MVAFLLALLLIWSATAHAKPLRIGVVFDGPSPTTDGLATLVEAETVKLMGAANVTFPQDKRATGEWSSASVNAACRAMLRDNKVDAVLGLGVLACRMPWPGSKNSPSLPSRRS